MTISVRFTALCAAVLLTLSGAVADEPESIRIAGSAWVGDAPTKVADRLGYFNLDLDAHAPRIEVLNFGSGLEAVQSLVEGQTQFALAATTPVATALLNQSGKRPDGLPDFAVLASVALSNRTHKLIVREDAGTLAPSDWDRLRVGVMFSTSSHFGWSHFATFHGLTEDNYTLIDVPAERMAEALLADEVDAVVIWSPWERKLADQIDDALIEHPLWMLYTVNWLLLVDRSFAHERPDIVRRVLNGYRKAIAFIDADPEGAHQLHADYIDVPLEHIINSSEGMIWRLGMNWSVLVNMGSQLEWLEAQPGFENLPKPGPQQYLYARPLQELAPKLVTLPDYLLLQSLTGEARP
jgi:ABC-type nitrate/sulfonate/bicarbonate transport system substrate-binding protein